MDQKQFTERATGKLVPIQYPIRNRAFVPDEMPPQWSFPVELWPWLGDALEALGTLNGIGRTLPDPGLLLRPLQSHEALTSSSLEGTFVTPQKLYLFELDPQDAEAPQKDNGEGQEVLNYGEALRRGRQLIDQGTPFGKELILEIHRVLMQGVRGEDKAPGQFRQQHVHIGSNLRFVPPPASDVVRLMDNLCWYVNQPSGPQLHPLVKACLVHVQFESIHPFMDGNGRVGRVLMALVIYKWLRHSEPWLYLSAYFEQYKSEYFDLMFRVSARGEWTQWVEFCLRGMVMQARDAIRRCELFRQLQAKYERQLTRHNSRTTVILTDLFSNPVLTIPSTARKFEVTYHTARSDVMSLVSDGILTPFEGGSRKCFMAEEIVRIAFSRSLEGIEVAEEFVAAR